MAEQQQDNQPFYIFDDKLYQPVIRRPKATTFPNKPIDQYLTANDTPMTNALTFKDQVTFTQIRRNKSIMQNNTMIYWIAYLQKKLYQQDKQTITDFKNKNQLEQYEQEFKTIIKKRINQNANDVADVKREQLMKQKGMLPLDYVRKETKEEI